MLLDFFSQKILPLENARPLVGRWQALGLEVVFTNGCFDLLHLGHLHYLAAARRLGDRLVVGLNSSESVRRLKGPERPINDEATRSAMLAALGFVDLVVVFGDDTPAALIEALRPDVLVKGGDYRPEDIVGAETVLSHGGAVMVLPFVEGYSTTGTLEKFRHSRFLP
jgi:rfaE bifunctional protein nucleotidyltransferase chain/domain